jgi:hypothetical protein
MDKPNSTLEQNPIDARTAARCVLDLPWPQQNCPANAQHDEHATREFLGVGPVLAAAVVATVADPTVFRSGRKLSA